MSKQFNNELIKLKIEHDGIRLDKYLSLMLTDLSRTKIQSIIQSGYVTIDDKIIKDCSIRVKQGNNCNILMPPPEVTDMLPADIALNIIYEDDDLIVINKQPGLTVHPGAGNYQDTLANALIKYYGEQLSSVGGVSRPGIVHRLDKDTSGLIVVAKNDFAHNSLAEQIKSKDFKRIYMTLIYGMPNLRIGKIEANIARSNKDRTKMCVVKFGGKTAITHYRVVKTFCNNKISLIECKLETGRTHQIRVHFSSKNWPIIGDQTYGYKGAVDKNFPQILQEFSRQALHAYKIEFSHPKQGKLMQFKVELPKDINELIYALDNL